MMKMLTDRTPKPFLREELVERVAAMLNYVISKIAGPKCIEVKVHAARIHACVRTYTHKQQIERIMSISSMFA